MDTFGKEHRGNGQGAEVISFAQGKYESLYNEFTQARTKINTTVPFLEPVLSSERQSELEEIISLSKSLEVMNTSIQQQLDLPGVRREENKTVFLGFSALTAMVSMLIENCDSIISAYVKSRNAVPMVSVSSIGRIEGEVPTLGSNDEQLTVFLSRLLNECRQLQGYVEQGVIAREVVLVWIARTEDSIQKVENLFPEFISQQQLEIAQITRLLEGLRVNHVQTNQ